MGLYGFALPIEHGGLGMTMTEEVQLVFELGYTTPAFRSMFGTNNGIAGHVLIEGGTDEQKRHLLPGLASGAVTAAFALTEAEAGSDPAGLVTRARRDSVEWVIDGAKRYITNAPIADVFNGLRPHQQGREAQPGDLCIHGPARRRRTQRRSQRHKDGSGRCLDRRRVPRRGPRARVRARGRERGHRIPNRDAVPRARHSR
jgi:alkylation response protein AidB-like acyl-CoA dehydrogenase